MWGIVGRALCAFFIFLALLLPSASASGTIYIVIDSSLYSRIKTEVDRLAVDMSNEGYAARIKSGSWKSPSSVKQILESGWKNDNLKGAVLIGDIPTIRFNHRQTTSYWHAYPTDLYLMDFDGAWKDADGDGIYDSWDRSAPEIWVSRIRADTLPALGNEVSLIKSYLDKNHKYRTGQLSLPPKRAYVVYHNIDIIRSQRDHNGWGASPDLIYDDVTIKGPPISQLSEDPNSQVTKQARQDWIIALSDKSGYELMVLNTASYPDKHMFAGAFEGSQNKLSSYDVKSIKPKKAVWFHLLTSETAYHDATNYIGGIYLFDSPTAVAIYGGAQHSGVAATRKLYESLSLGKSFGEALLEDLKYKISNYGQGFTEYVAWASGNRETWKWSAGYPTVLLGDGTLKLPAKEKNKKPVRIILPEDGGWPRNNAKITDHGNNYFTIHPDRHTRYMYIEIENSANSVQDVVLDGFIINFARRKGDPENGPYSGRQYLWVKYPGKAWKRVYRTDEKQNFPYGKLMLSVPPGITKVSTVVPVTYSEYISYVEGLSSPYLSKQVIFTSGNGKFKTYRIRITNPESPVKKKLKIALANIDHHYEHAGFYMAQGAIEWLLSGDPAANLDNIEWTIYPLLDPEAVYRGGDYDEYKTLRLDNGKTIYEALHGPYGEIPSQKFHVLTNVHMWEFQDWESYKYNDPKAPSGAAGNGKSEIERVMLSFWPYWYEFGIDRYDHENKWGAQNARPDDFGGALVTQLEIPFYGKDDIDPRQRLREQGKLWALSHSQAFLRFSPERGKGYWKEFPQLSNPVLLPLPEVVLLEDLPIKEGSARKRANANGQTMRIYNEDYLHGIGMKGGRYASFTVPDKGTGAFRAMVAVDDAETNPSAKVVFVAKVNGKEVWRSKELKKGERELAEFGPVKGGDTLTLSAEGTGLADWGGAKIIFEGIKRKAGLTIGKWELGELSFSAKKSYSNPFKDVSLEVEFTSPSGKTLKVPGFFDGGKTWKVRFALDEIGTWTWVSRSSDSGLVSQGAIEVIPSSEKGFVRPRGNHFFYDNGEPFFYMGDTSYRLAILSDSQRSAYVQTRKSQHFTHIRMLAGYVDGGIWPFGGSPKSPDVSTLNLDYFKNLDRIIEDLKTMGMGVEMIMLNYYDEPVKNPSVWKKENEEMWLKYLIARYSAYTNLIQWTITNEYELYPDGRYRYNPSKEKEDEWARSRITFVKQNDPFRHPVTVHPDVSDSNAGANFGNVADIVQHQTGKKKSASHGGMCDGCKNCYVWDPSGLDGFVKADLKYGKPVVVGEFGYEYNRYTCRGVNVDTDTLRKTAWTFKMGGAYFSAGFRSTVYNFNGIKFDIGNNNGKAQHQLKYLAETFLSLPFWKLEPSGIASGAMALSDGESVVLAYTLSGGAVRIDLSKFQGMFSAKAVNPRTGEEIAMEDVQGGSVANLDSPGSGDWAFLLRKKKPSSCELSGQPCDINGCPGTYQDENGACVCADNEGDGCPPPQDDDGTETFSVSFIEGWNVLYSKFSSVIPENELEGLCGNVNIFGVGENKISIEHDLRPHKGYIIKVEKDCTIEGEKAIRKAVELYRGWNIFSPPSDITVDAFKMLCNKPAVFYVGKSITPLKSGDVLEENKSYIVRVNDRCFIGT